MASFRKRGDKWEVFLCVRGVRVTSSHPTKRAASAWAAAKLAELETVRAGGCPDLPVLALFERYAKEVSPSKRGCEKERIRLLRLSRDELALVRLPLIRPAHFAAWRDRRLREVSVASVLRDWSLLHHVFTIAVQEWGLLQENPMRGVRKPKTPLSRDRLISESEISRLILAFGYDRDLEPMTITARVGAAFLFAIETGMRCGEICNLVWSGIEGAVAHLSMTKNGFSRSVPLSVEALRIIGQLSRVNGDERVFRLKQSQVVSLFRKVRERVMIKDLHFHDTRHEAITRLARRLDVLDLARMVGIRDLRILMVYYNAKPQDIAVRLG